jgi:hypothetical protein
MDIQRSSWLLCIWAISAITILFAAHPNVIPSIGFTICSRSMGILCTTTTVAEYAMQHTVISSNDVDDQNTYC